MQELQMYRNSHSHVRKRNTPLGDSRATDYDNNTLGIGSVAISEKVTCWFRRQLCIVIQTR